MCVVVVIFSVSTVREENAVDTGQETTKTVKILSSLDRYRQQVKVCDPFLIELEP